MEGSDRLARQERWAKKLARTARRGPEGSALRCLHSIFVRVDDSGEMSRADRTVKLRYVDGTRIQGGARRCEPRYNRSAPEPE